MKRITILILSLVLLLLLSACAPEIGSTGTFDSSEMPHTEDISEPDEADKAGADTNSKVNEQQMTYEKFDFDKKTVRLNSGYEMPIVGLGTWTLSNEEAEESVYQALKAGMRLIDTARYYGNEVGVGRGLQRAIDEGIVSREEVFITSKIYGGNYERTGGIIDDAIQDLNVDYIDLLLIHQPGADDEGVYKAMEEAVNDGKLRSIGISNYYTKEQVDEVLSFATIIPAVIQNENHLYYQNTELQEYVKQYGIVIESWYPLGGRGHTSEHFNNDVILGLAEKYNKSSAQIIIRWQLQAGFITIPGSSNPEHIEANYDVFDFELSEEDMRIDFNEIASMTFPGMDNGTGMMSARMYNDDSYRIIPTAIHPGGSIGNHKQNSGDDMNYIISGTGKAFCDGMEEDLKPGVMHICPQGSEHSIVNTGEEDLVMLTIVVKK